MYYRIRLLSLTRQNKKMAYEMKTDYRSTNSGRKTPAFANYRFACFEFVSTSSKVAEQTDLQVVTTRVKTCEIFAILFPVYACFAYICWKKKKERKGEKEHTSRACSWQIARNLVEKIFITFHLSLCPTVN